MLRALRFEISVEGMSYQTLSIIEYNQMHSSIFVSYYILPIEGLRLSQSSINFSIPARPYLYRETNDTEIYCLIKVFVKVRYTSLYIRVVGSFIWKFRLRAVISETLTPRNFTYWYSLLEGWWCRIYGPIWLGGAYLNSGLHNL